MYSDADITQIGEGLLARTLPKAEWTHAAHCIACIYLLRQRPDIDVGLELPGIIWRYNAAGGTANSDSDGYHETITRFYIALISAYLARLGSEATLSDIVRDFLASPWARRDLLFDYWSRDRLMSVEARRVWVAPDRAALDFRSLMD